MRKKINYYKEFCERLDREIKEKAKDLSPIKNPYEYTNNENFKFGMLGDKGKVYHKRKRFLYPTEHPDNTYYMIPGVWEQPVGFSTDWNACWGTHSEYHAINHYRYAKKASGILRRKWNEIIKKQDYLYSLSKAIDSNFELPKLKSGFEVRPHQKVGIEFGLLTNGKFIIADQQRTGKSFTALLYCLSQTWDKCLIVCPAKVVPVWESMIQKICDLPITVLNSNDSLQPGFNIISYDSLHTIDDLTCDITIADEAHFIIESTARRSQAINRIESPKKLALSGTPIMNSINDMLGLLKWLDKDIHEEMDLFLYYLNYGDEQNEKFKLNDFEKTAIFCKELKRLCLLLRETNQVSNVKEPYLNFIEINAKIKNPKDLQEIGRAKVNYAVEYCNSFNEKILVAFYYKETGRMLKARLGNKAVLIDGDSTKKEVENAKKAFAGDTRILIGSTVLAEGLDFSFCNNLLMMEESSFSMRTDQIRERLNRVNKEEEVTIDILIVKGTQDDRLYELLNNKFELQEGLRIA